jgi:broad specificity phosphatase PhoE
MSLYDECQDPHERETNLVARFTLIAHAATESQRCAAFPLDEPIAEREISKISGFNWTLPRARHMWSAPEQRAQQTARILGLQAIVSDELRDCDYGRWRGRTMDEVQSEDPEGILAWLTNPYAAPHGGESIKDLIGRIGSWMDDQREVDHTLAVTHPAVIRAAIVYALRIPAQKFWRFDVSPLTLSDLRFNGNVWTLRCVGCSLIGSRQAEESESDS